MIYLLSFIFLPFVISAIFFEPWWIPATGSGELSPASIHSLQGGGSQDIGSSGSKMRETGSRMSEGDMGSPSKKLEAAKRQAKETGTNTLENMPCVFTKGDGPNGRRVDGILYRYGKGEEVRIMCVCHGSFHSPAEFVKHAGGTDVAHPLKHIVINPNASPLLWLISQAFRRKMISQSTPCKAARTYPISIFVSLIPLFKREIYVSTRAHLGGILD